MSWFTNVFGPVLRVFGWGRPKDKPIPAPLPGSERIQLLQEAGSPTEAVQRESEAIQAIRGFVGETYQITDRRIWLHAFTFDDAKKAFVARGNDPKNWPSNRIGMFYAPKGGDGYAAKDGQIHLVLKDLPQPERVTLALHEYGHAIWHWLLTPDDWLYWQSRNWPYELFADDFARRMLGEKLSGDKVRFFERLESRLKEQGTKSLRL